MSVCPVCKCKFPIHYVHRGQPQKYCSKKCRYAGIKIKCVCRTCGKVFIRSWLGTRSSHIYCSLECHQRTPCKVCGTIITGRNRMNHRLRSFCGRRCSSIANQVLGKKKSSYTIKAFFECLQKQGEIKCSMCGCSDKRALAVHHPVGRKNGHNTLQVLCANCHHVLHWGTSTNRSRAIQIAEWLYKIRPDIDFEKGVF